MFFSENDVKEMKQAAWRTWETIASDLLAAVQESDPDKTALPSDEVKECIWDHIEMYGQMSPEVSALFFNRKFKKHVDVVLDEVFEPDRSWG